ncbi:hypothetical protein [Atopococcus tabaci]|uniref:hypothetical protein n=1 Tax=Atopococcus tabaci TaxID=269774 RepID=UPI000419B9DB|nr:hypothetical protein [Atopococcus tabaci]
MQNFLNIMGGIGNFFLPIFLTMFNVGLTQTIQDLTEYLKDWKFYLRMLLANFVPAPLVMYLLL